MVSMGGGAALLIAVVIGLFVAERLWLKILCGAGLGLYLVAVVWGLAVGELKPDDLIGPAIVLAFAYYVARVVKAYRKW